VSGDRFSYKFESGVFTLTFMIFPGLTASLKPHSGALAPDWFILALFVSLHHFASKLIGIVT
jgi:hypothetical protein